MRFVLRSIPCAAVALAGTAPAQHQLFEHPGSLAAPGDTSFGHCVDGGSDLDGDGVPDVLAGTHQSFFEDGQVAVISGADGQVIHSITGTDVGVASGEEIGEAVAFVPDLDGDGVDDFVFTESNSALANRVHVRSGLTGAGLGVVQDLSGKASQSWGFVLAGLGDLDGDGAGDFAVGDYFWGGGTGQGRVLVYSGGGVAAGAPNPVVVTHEGEPNDLHGHSIADLGDLDGDGTPEYAIGAESDAVPGPNPPFDVKFAGQVHVYSGATHGRIFSAQGAFEAHQSFGYSCAAADVDGDGWKDLVVGAPGAAGAGFSPSPYVEVYSGSAIGSGAAAASVPILSISAQAHGDASGFGEFVAGAGDTDGDGSEDLVITFASKPGLPPQAGSFQLRSGAGGALLLEVDGDAYAELGGQVGAPRGRPVAGLGDVDGDGLSEFLVGAHLTGVADEGAVHVYAGVDKGLPSHATVETGSGCGAGALPPHLFVSAGSPQLGDTVTLGAEDVTPFTAGLVFVGSPAPVPIPLGGGCAAGVDLATLVPFAPASISQSGTNLSLASFYVPFHWFLAGQSIAFQAVFLPTAGPLGLDVTNALALTLGY